MSSTENETPSGGSSLVKKVALAVVVVFALVALFVARPAYTRLKTWRAHALVTKALALLDDAHWAEASKIAYSAYQLNPNDPVVLRLLAELYTRASCPDQAIPFLESLVKTGDANLDDRRHLTQLALALNRYGVALEQVRFLLDHGERAPEDLYLAAEFFHDTGNLESAIRFGREAVERSKGNDALKLFLAKLLASSDHAGDRTESKAMLLEIAHGMSHYNLEAWEWLSHFPSLTPDEARETEKALTSYGDTRQSVFFEAQELRMRLQPDRKAGIIAKTIDRYQGGGDAERIGLARWLNQQGDHASVVKLIGDDESRKSQDLFLVRLDAMAATGNWKGVGAALEKDPVPIEPAIRELYRARLEQEQGNRELAALHWNRVHALAGDKPETLLYIAQYAERSHAYEEAEKVYHKLTMRVETSMFAYQALVRLAEMQGDTSGLRDLMKEIVAAFPADPRPRNDMAYLDLLLEQHVPEAKAAAVELVQRQPNLLSYRTTLALACLRTNDAKGAMTLYQDRSIDWKEALPGWQAVYAAVLGANKREPEAKKLAKDLDWQRLKPEERRLIQAWRN